MPEPFTQPAGNGLLVAVVAAAVAIFVGHLALWAIAFALVLGCGVFLIGCRKAPLLRAEERRGALMLGVLCLGVSAFGFWATWS